MYLEYSLLDYILGVPPTDLANRKPCSQPNIRGWNIETLIELGEEQISPSDLLPECPTGRYLYLAKKVRLKRDTLLLRQGREVHEEAFSVWRLARDKGEQGLMEAARIITTTGGLWALVSAARWLEHRDLVPVSIEPRIPSPPGFTIGKPDLLLSLTPVELVLSRPNSWSWRRKRIVLASYGLFLEWSLHAPVDFGYLVSLSTGTVERVCLNDDLKNAVIEEYGRRIRALEYDPGPPADSRLCPQNCPFYSTCWGEIRGGGREASSSESRFEYQVAAGSS